MPTLKFQPQGTCIEVEANTKVLVAANRAKAPIRFGCGSCRCGTCGVAVDTELGELNPLPEDEKKMLTRLKLPLDGTVRMACRARIISGRISIDLDFQDTYEPDDDFEDS